MTYGNYLKGWKWPEMIGAKDDIFGGCFKGLKCKMKPMKKIEQRQFKSLISMHGQTYLDIYEMFNKLKWNLNHLSEIWQFHRRFKA